MRRNDGTRTLAHSLTHSHVQRVRTHTGQEQAEAAVLVNTSIGLPWDVPAGIPCLFIPRPRRQTGRVDARAVCPAKLGSALRP